MLRYACRQPRVGLELMCLGACMRTLQATYGRYNAAGCVVVDHDLIACKTEPGIGSALPWFVTVGGQQSTDTITSTYGAPRISSVVNSTSWLTSGNFVVRTKTETTL